MATYEVQRITQEMRSGGFTSQFLGLTEGSHSAKSAPVLLLHDTS